MQVEWGYATALFIAATLSILVAWISWRRRRAPGSIPLFIFMLALAWWAGTYAFHWLRLPQPRLFFWLDATYLGVVIAPGAFLIFALIYTGRKIEHPKRLVALLSIEPLLTTFFLWTDPLHGWFFGNNAVREEAILDGGPLFIFNVAYSYGLVLTALLLLIQARLQSHAFNRRQLNIVVVGAFLPFFTNIISLSDLNPFTGLDLTPFAFTLTGISLAVGLFYYGLLDIVPVARHTLVEEMHDGVLVLDTFDRIVDINPTAQKMIGQTADSPIGKSAVQIFAPWPNLLERFQFTRAAQEEIAVNTDPMRVIDLHISPLYDSKQTFNGRLIVFRDITERKEIEEQLRQANQRLQQQLKEIEALQDQLREQALRDPLTGLFNRRYLAEAMRRELAQSIRQGWPLSVVLMDIDSFKAFNDVHGHTAGDRMLQALSELLQSKTRGSDFVCRYGGEEFVIVLPFTAQAAAIKRMQEFCQIFEAFHLAFEDQQLNTTLSIGVAAFPQDGETGDQLLDAADKAMYRAKAKGGNRVGGTSTDP
ncbi:MAG: diguanylate cyclase [Chloroflexi bacterium]|nr:diguanylate cyclase [Chloroflexota bacterium]